MPRGLSSKELGLTQLTAQRGSLTPDRRGSEPKAPCGQTRFKPKLRKPWNLVGG
jgi:hypothetical protein